MDIRIRLAFDENAAVRLLNWLVGENTRIIRDYDRRYREAARDGRPGDLLPLLYESGVVYRREETEIWCDYLLMLTQGWEDCDGLSAVRAGELRARGWRALAPKDPNDPLRYPGDGGYEWAMRHKPESIKAQAVCVTRTQPGETGLYHCITKYAVGGRIYYDDPSARLGMYDADAGDRSHALLMAREPRRVPGFPAPRVGRDLIAVDQELSGAEKRRALRQLKAAGKLPGQQARPRPHHNLRPGWAMTPHGPLPLDLDEAV